MSLSTMSYITGALVALALALAGFYVMRPDFVVVAFIFSIAFGFVYQKIGQNRHIEKMMDPEYAKKAIEAVEINLPGLEDLKKAHRLGFDAAFEVLLDELKNSSVVITTKNADPEFVGLLKEEDKTIDAESF